MIPRYPKRRDIRHRLVNTIERQRKDDISRVAESSTGGPGNGLRLWDAGNIAVTADFDNDHSSDDLLVSFQDASNVEQSGGFTFSDHPSAMHYDDPGFSAAQSTSHCFSVPSDGTYTVSLDFTPRPFAWSALRAPITAIVALMPDGLFNDVYLAPASIASSGVHGGINSDVRVSTTWTQFLTAATPNWIQLNVLGWNDVLAGTYDTSVLCKILEVGLTVAN